MLTLIKSAVDIAGGKSAVAIAGGGLLMLLGLVGLAVLLVLARQPVPERARSRHSLPIIGSVLLIVIGGSVLLGVGIIYPLQILKWYASDVRVQADQEDLLRRVAKVESEQFIHALLNQPKYQDPNNLNRYEFKMFSQNGEDGIIAEIFRRIGTTNRYFVEFGSSDGSENNTVFLLRLGWSGLWIDGDPPAISRARRDFRPEIERGNLTVTEAFITAENIEDLFHQAKVPEEFDVLSVDIDRNDYYVWEKISRYRPRAVVIEYNSSFPPTMSWVVPYDPKAWGFNQFGTGNGASLKALEELGTKKGYSLVGCELCGVNAFFVRDDLRGDRFAAPYTAEHHYEPFRNEYMLIHHYQNSVLSGGSPKGQEVSGPAARFRLPQQSAGR